jgi:hypothetical protein
MRLLEALAFTAIVVWVLPAQTQETFKSRLAPVPIDAQLTRVVSGHGSVSATLSGNKLTVNGTFEGLRSGATTADLHQSKITGVSGVRIHELTVSKAIEGAVTGSVDLTSQEVEALHKGLLYVLVHSQGAPEGNLWGWLVR